MTEQETGMIVVDPETSQQIDQLVAWSQGVAVRNEIEKAAVLDIVRGAKTQRKTLDEFFDPGIKQAHELHKALVAQKKGFTDRLDMAEAAGKRAILAFDQEQARVREEERRRLQAIADEQARKERERLEKEAARLKTPEKQAERLEQAAAVAAPVVQVAEAPKAEGASTRKIWKARVIDVALVPREFMVVNEKALDAMAKATKGATPVAGVEFYAEEIMAIR